jgi:hypothetical protein
VLPKQSRLVWRTERFPHVILADFSLEICVDKGKLHNISNAKQVLLERNNNCAFTICCFCLVFFFSKPSIAYFALFTQGAEETI